MTILYGANIDRTRVVSHEIWKQSCGLLLIGQQLAPFRCRIEYPLRLAKVKSSVTVRFTITSTSRYGSELTGTEGRRIRGNQFVILKCTVDILNRIKGSYGITSTRDSDPSMLSFLIAV